MLEELSDEYSLSDLPLWSDDSAAEILASVCNSHQVPVEAVTQLVALQRERQHQERASGIYMSFEEILASFD